MPEIITNVVYSPLAKTVTTGHYATVQKSQPSIAARVARGYSTLAAAHNIGGNRALPPLLAADLNKVTAAVRVFIEESAQLCQPDAVHICDGSDAENRQLLDIMQERGTIEALPKYENCWLACTNPADVARVESRTFICTVNRTEAIPTPGRTDVQGTLGNWISPAGMEQAIQERFPGCMKGRTMYVIPYSMGPIGSPLSKIGIEITDSPYVVSSMRVMTRMGAAVLDELTSGRTTSFVKCLHSVGIPADGKVEQPAWPCDPARTIILHRPATNDIVSYGSGYGGNSLLGKKCFALRIGSTIAEREGWLAEHMLILGITNPDGEKRYIAAAFPSACGKTNLAMMTPALPGYKIECVGDDIAWMRFDAAGQLRAINPENGFFGVAPGTSTKTNPIAMQTIFKNTVFTNVARTSDGGVYWEGMEDEIDESIEIVDWQKRPFKRDGNVARSPAAHPNSRFCSPAAQCPIIDSAWEDPEGVPISAILFGGRRPTGVPLVYESLSWQHGVFVGASMRSETTAAAEHKGKVIMNDPFAMRPFFGYNFGNYLKHWLSMEQRGRVPKIFHVNWFRKSATGAFLWPGFGENARVLDWILKRVDNQECYRDTPIGRIPAPGSLNTQHMSTSVDMAELFSIPKQFWLQEVDDIEAYFKNQVAADLPKAIDVELKSLRARLEDYS